MSFKDGQPIYQQIAERLADEVLSGAYPPETRVPGVREYSALLEVNVNTTVKAFDLLAQRGIIYARRGMGYYVANDATQLILTERQKDFREQVMPDFFMRMLQLHISMDDVEAAFRQYKEKMNHASGEHALNIDAL